MSSKSADQIADCIEYLLARPPAETGLQLKPERELAAIFKQDQSVIRQVMGRLENKGLLTRVRGSGTFIRRVLHLPEDRPDPFMAFGLNPVDLLAGGNGFQFSPVFRTSSRKLQLGLLSDLSLTGPTSSRLLSSMLNRAGEKGHHLMAYPVFNEDEAQKAIHFGLPPEERIAGLLETDVCDGYLVLASWGDLFLKCLGNRRIPHIFFWLATHPLNHDPLIQFDTVESVERAVRIFARENLQRIAMLSTVTTPVFQNMAGTAYERAMELCGFSHRQVEYTTLDTSQVFAAVKRLFDKQTGCPEALYISDDNLLPPVVAALAEMGKKPGGDLPIITLGNRGIALPDGFEWSRLEFNPDYLGRLLVDQLLQAVQVAGSEVQNLKIQARWRAGTTHLAKNARKRLKDRKWEK
ncbi:MAG: GntR family transcriptional regulator [Verrucomicrobiae bacterium]|nr:GntR family transcriptional regulator [Verrucomicrobiae bacterium]